MGSPSLVSIHCRILRRLKPYYSYFDRLLADGGRTDPFFKPDWSPDLFFSMNYLGHFFFLRKKLFENVGGIRNDFASKELYDLLLRATDSTQRIGHIQTILYSKANNVFSNIAIDAGKNALRTTLERRGIKGEVIPLKREGTYRVKYKISSFPKVSIIIPTAYKKPELLQTCLSSLIQNTTYSNYEILIVDNSFGRLQKINIHNLIPASISWCTLKYEEPFNFSKMNNCAAKQATGDYFLFLNDDTQVISPDWIEAMVEHAQRSEIGVVGAKLLYPDGKIQHGGMFLVDYGGGGRGRSPAKRPEPGRAAPAQARSPGSPQRAPGRAQPAPAMGRTIAFSSPALRSLVTCRPGRTRHGQGRQQQNQCGLGGCDSA